ncbi:MAG TPA: cation diffusion facilitator family transporter [Cyclobacteriaceae bacterium]|nr:cation diffusion facilitator family transporter [Cyclobacteriaceae bacterium]
MDATAKNIRIQRWVAALSVSLLIVKLVAYYQTHSVAILTDALEGIVNVVAGFFGLYSLTLSAKPRDEDHPYGHGKIEFISAGVEGSMIFLAGLLIIYESVVSLIAHNPLHKLDNGIILIGTTAVLNFVAGYICINAGKKSDSLVLVASGKHLQSDTITTLGVLVGLALIFFTGQTWIDSAVALLFSLWILYTGYTIIRKSVAGIMDESDHQLLARMVDLLNKNRRENWVDLHNVRFIKYGSKLHLDGHLTIPWYLNVNEAHREIDMLAKLIRKEFDESLELFVHSDGCVDFSCRICNKQGCPVRKHPFEKRVEWTIENIVNDRKHQV